MCICVDQQVFKMRLINTKNLLFHHLFSVNFHLNGLQMPESPKMLNVLD